MFNGSTSYYIMLGCEIHLMSRLLAAVDRRGKHLERRKQGWPRAFVAPLNGLIGPLGGPLGPLGQPGGI